MRLFSVPASVIEGQDILEIPDINALCLQKSLTRLGSYNSETFSCTDLESILLAWKAERYHLTVHHRQEAHMVRHLESFPTGLALIIYSTGVDLPWSLIVPKLPSKPDVLTWTKSWLQSLGAHCRTALFHSLQFRLQWMGCGGDEAQQRAWGWIRDPNTLTRNMKGVLIARGYIKYVKL